MVAEQVPGGAISVGLVIIGAFLALIGSIAVELIRAWNSDRRKRNFFMATLKAELPLIVYSIEVLGRTSLAKASPESRGPLVASLRNALSRFERHWDDIMLLKDISLSQHLIHFLVALGHLCDLAETPFLEEDMSETSELVAERGDVLIERLGAYKFTPPTIKK